MGCHRGCHLHISRARIGATYITLVLDSIPTFVGKCVYVIGQSLL